MIFSNTRYSNVPFWILLLFKLCSVPFVVNTDYCSNVILCRVCHPLNPCYHGASGLSRWAPPKIILCYLILDYQEFSVWQVLLLCWCKVRLLGKVNFKEVFISLAEQKFAQLIHWKDSHGFTLWQDSSPWNAAMASKICKIEDFPGGPVVKKPAANTEDTGLILNPRRFHMPRSNSARALAT